jgi:hypothetical protein
MDPVEKSDAYTVSSTADSDPPPPYTPQTSNTTSINDERNPSSIPSIMGEVKVFTTYHIYLEQNYLLPFKSAVVKHLNSDTPTYRFECPDKGPDAGHLLMHTPSTPSIAHATFAPDFGSSTLTLHDGRIVSISVVKRTSARQETRLFRLDMQNVKSEQHPSVMFWEMGAKNYGPSKGGVGNYELMDEERKVHAVLVTAHHKSMKKVGRLHFLVEPGEGLVEVVVGTLMTVWKKADRDVRRGHVGLRS